MIETITPKVLPEYQLIDSGDFEKLERFGKWVLRRPEPQAVWSKSMSEQDWEIQSHATFVRKNNEARDVDSGNWTVKR